MGQCSSLPCGRHLCSSDTRLNIDLAVGLPPEPLQQGVPSAVEPPTPSQSSLTITITTKLPPPVPELPPAHQPPVRYAYIGEDERRQWKDFGGKMIEALLMSGAVAMLDAAWLVTLAEKGGTLRRRQDTPDEAFISFNAIKSAGCTQDSLPIAIVSAPWLTSKLPDPRGHSLRMVARALKIMIDDGKRRGKPKGQRWGVIWDVRSLAADVWRLRWCMRGRVADSIRSCSIRMFGGSMHRCTRRPTSFARARPSGSARPRRRRSSSAR